MPRKTNRPLTRRSFLKTAAVSATAPAIVPVSVFARPAPSDRLNIGCIGVGRQGQGDMQELIYRGLETGARVTAVCDVDRHRREDAAWLAGKIYARELKDGPAPDIKEYADFREVLARPDEYTGTDAWGNLVDILRHAERMSRQTEAEMLVAQPGLLSLLAAGLDVGEVIAMLKRHAEQALTVVKTRYPEAARLIE